MKLAPFFTDELATVYHGDALQVLSDLGLSDVSAFVCDPPYASGARTEAAKSARGDGMVRAQRWANRPIDTDQMTTTGFVWLIRETALLARDALADGGSFFSFIDWRQWPNLVGAVESANFRINKMVVWDKESFGMGNGFRNQHELILFASKGVPDTQNSNTPDVLRFKREPNTWHPSPKPEDLMEALLRVAAPVGGLVVDPFMGAGATLVAARRLGIRAIGIDSEEKHCETARARLIATATNSTIDAVRAGQRSLFE